MSCDHSATKAHAHFFNGAGAGSAAGFGGTDAAIQGMEQIANVVRVQAQQQAREVAASGDAKKVKAHQAQQTLATGKTAKLFRQWKKELGPDFREPAHGAVDPKHKVRLPSDPAQHHAFAAIYDTREALLGKGKLPAVAHRVMEASSRRQIKATGVDAGGYHRCTQCGQFASQTKGHTCRLTASVDTLANALGKRLGVDPAVYSGSPRAKALMELLLADARTNGVVLMRHGLSGEKIAATLDGTLVALQQGFTPEVWRGAAETGPVVAGKRVITVPQTQLAGTYGLAAYELPTGAVPQAAGAYGSVFAPATPLVSGGGVSAAYTAPTDATQVTSGSTYTEARFVGSLYKKRGRQHETVQIGDTTYRVGQQLPPGREHWGSARRNGIVDPPPKGLVVGRVITNAAVLLQTAEVVETPSGVVELYAPGRSHLLGAYDPRTRTAGDMQGTENMSAPQLAAVMAYRELHPQSDLDHHLAADIQALRAGTALPTAVADSAYSALRRDLATGNTIDFGASVGSQRCGDCGQWMGTQHTCPAGTAPDPVAAAPAASTPDALTATSAEPGLDDDAAYAYRNAEEEDRAAPDTAALEDDDEVVFSGADILAPAPETPVAQSPQLDEAHNGARDADAPDRRSSAAQARIDATTAALDEAEATLLGIEARAAAVVRAVAKADADHISGPAQDRVSVEPSASGAFVSPQAEAHLGRIANAFDTCLALLTMPKAPEPEPIATPSAPAVDESAPGAADTMTPEDIKATRRAARTPIERPARPANMPTSVQEHIFQHVVLPAQSDPYLSNLPSRIGGDLDEPLPLEIPPIDGNYEVDDSTEKALRLMSSALQLAWSPDNTKPQAQYQSFGLYGPPGTGKNTAARQVAATIGLPYVETTINPDTSAQDEIGRTILEAGSTRAQLGKIGQAAAAGAVICINEIVRSPRMATAFQSMMEDREIEIQGTEGGIMKIPVHPNTVFVFTWNPGTEGDDDRPALAPLARMMPIELQRPSLDEQADRLMGDFLRMKGRTDTSAGGRRDARRQEILSRDYANKPIEVTQKHAVAAARFMNDVAALSRNGQMAIGATPGPRETRRFLYTAASTGDPKLALEQVKIYCDQDPVTFADQWALVEETFASVYGHDGQALNAGNPLSN